MNENCYAMTIQQRNLWAQRPEVVTEKYNSVSIIINGIIDRQRLRDSLHEVINEHESLRMELVHDELYHLPRQSVVSPKLIWQETPEGDDNQMPTSGSYGVHATLTALAIDKHQLAIRVPVLFTDSQSLQNIFKQLVSRYSGKAPSLASTEYIDYGLWQQEMIEQDNQATEFWSYHESEVEDIQAPSERGNYEVGLPDSVESNIVLAQWAGVLAQYSGNNPLSINVVLDGRVNPELRDAVGLYARALPLQLTIGETESVKDVALQLADKLKANSAYQLYAPEAISSSMAFAFQAMQIHNVQASEGAEFVIVDLDCCHTYQGIVLKLLCFENGKRVAKFDYAEDQYTTEQIEDLANMLLCALSHQDDDKALLATQLLDAEKEQSLLSQLNPTPSTTPNLTSLFSDSFAAYAKDIAVTNGEVSYDYATLGSDVGKCIAFLTSHGYGRGDTIGVMLPRSYELLVLLLASIYSGVSYCAIDPKTKGKRLERLLTGLKCTFVKHSCVEVLDSVCHDTKVFDIDSAWQSISECSEVLLQDITDNTDIAYRLYTSGSTGEPKGVEVTRQGLANYLSYAAKHYLSHQGNSLVHTAISFDLTVTSLFSPLLVGGSVQLVEGDETDDFKRALVDIKNINLLKITPSHLKLVNSWLASGELESLCITHLVVGGESLQHEDLAPLFQHNPDIKVFNEYGPTEATVGCCVARLERGGKGNAAIGLPIDNMQMYVLDNALRVAPYGIAGEVYIGGTGLAAGYFEKEQLTRERFLTVRIAGEDKRLYKSGDVAKLNRTKQGAELVFLGRNDRQIKINGYRIELDEVERVISQVSGKNTLVTTRENQLSKLSICAFLETPEQNLEETLPYQLEEFLPHYMIPDKVITLDAFSLNTNGKVDIQKLLAHADSKLSNVAYVEPSTPLEAQLVSIWQESLKVERIGINDNFFSLGGDSIRVVQIVGGAKKQQLEISSEDVFQAPTIAKLANLIETRQKRQAADEAQLTEQLLAEIEMLSEEEVERLLAEG